MVRETNNVCFGQIAQETQVVVREDNKRDHLKRSTEDVSPPNFTERNSGYYERSSRLVAETDSYIRRSNSNNNTINNYQSSGNNNSSNNSASSNLDNSRSRTRDRLYRNGPYIAASGASATSGSSTATSLSERTSSGGATSKHNNNSRVPPASWYEAAATYTNGPGGSGNADVSAANINNHYQTASSTDIQTAAAASTANSTTTSSSYTAYSYASSPAHNNNTSVSSTTTPSAASASRNNTSVYGNVSCAAAVGGYHPQQRDSDSTETPLLNKNKHKLLKSCSSSRSGSTSPTSSGLAAGTAAAGASTMTSSSTSAATVAPTSSSSSSTSAANNSNQTANNNNNSCSSISSTINSSNTNNNSLTSSSTAITAGDGNNVSGILNAAALAAAASNGSASTDGHHKSSSSSNNNHPNSSTSNASINTTSTSNNPSASASHHTSRSAVHAHFHGRSTTSSSRSHSRSPSSYSSSHSSSSSSSSTASSHSHASSPVGGRDVETSSSTAQATSRSSRSLQSAVAVPGTSSALNPSGSNVCSSSSSSSSSTSSGTPSANPVVHSEDNRPLAIRVRNLPARSSDTSLKDGLFHEYKKHGKVTWVKVVGQNAERYALVCFKKPEDVEKALEVSHDKLFFGCKIEVEPYQGYDVEDNEFRPYEAELDEYHPKSTRTLFIGNLEKEITASELRQHFECFGEIIEIDIKKQGMSAYAFCQYSDIVSVVKAMRKMDGEHLGNNRIKLGFGKSMPTNCVWIDGIGEKISESHLQSQFSRYGAVSKVVVDRQKQLALVLYEQIQYAQTAVKEMRGATLRGRKLQVDFASRECQDAFYEKLEKQTAGSRFSRYESQSRSRASSFSRHQNSNDGCSPSNTPGSSSSSSAGVSSSAPTLSSAIVAGCSINTSSNNTGGSGATLPSVVGQTSGNTTPARSRGSRSSRHTMDYDYIDTRRFRSYDEYSQGSGASHDEDATITNHPASSSNTNSYSGIGLRSDSPLLSRLGPIVNSTGKESNSDMLEMALSRRRCDKSPAKQKGDVRLFQKERAVLLEQFEECPSSGDESIVSPRKRIKIDHHSINSSSVLSQSHSLEEQTQQHKNLNCDYLLNDSMHRKGEVRRLSECSSSLNKYQQQANHHHHSHHAINPHHHHHQQQQQLSRRPSIDFMTTGGGSGGGGGASGSGTVSLSARHGSTSSSNSDHHPPPHQPSSSLACKRRRVIGSGSSALSTSALLSSSSGGAGSNIGAAFPNDDFHHHASRGRGHQLHSHHSHEASGGESADGSRPGTPLCDERPEVLPSEPRRVPRERPREPMVLPLPKFGIQFFQQFRNNAGSGSNISSSYHHHHHGGVANSSSGFASSSATIGSTNTGSSHMLSNSLMNRGGEGSISSNNHSSLSHSSATTSSAITSAMPSSGGCYLPSPSTRFPPNWRPHHHHHHHHSGGGGHGGATPSSCSSMVSPLRSRSLSSNSSDSDVTGQASGSPSLEERIRTLDEMYERWSGGSSATAAGTNVVKRHDFTNTPPTWQHHRSSSQTDLHHPTTPADVRPTAPSTPASRHKFLDIDVKEIQPSEIVKSVLAKKSIFDDDLQRLKKNHWYEPTSDSSQVAKNIVAVCTSPGLPNLQATKTPVVGCTTTLPTSSVGGSINKPSGVLLQRLTSLSPMNSPQASMSPYNSPSMSPSVNSVSTLSTSIIKPTTSSCGTTMISPSPVCSTAGTSPASSGGSKCLQYPFPTHPPLPNTAAPLLNNQPIPPPPAEILKPSVTQPPLPPMEVHQPPQPPPVVTTATPTVGVISKPKTSALSKSLSVPTTVTTSTTETRVLTKSVSVPGSTNVGTVKTATTSLSTDQKQPQQMQTGNSSSSDSTNNPSSAVSTSEPTTSKRSEKSHKHNHRSSEDKKSSKSDKRKNSNSSQSQMSQASAAESSDADERDFENRKDRAATRSEKLLKERQEKREKELRKQQEREEREREREERDRLEKERIEKERLERERLEKERLEKEERERLQREEKAREERDRKDREDTERKLKEQREREERERVEREENERLEREEREEQTRKERKEREESELREKERSERQRSREEKDRERKSQEESCVDQKRDIHQLKEHQRRKESSVGIQHQAKSISNDTTVATSQAAQDFFRQGETERHNNKENATDESPTMESTCVSSGKHKNRKTSRNTSPVRHPKRRLSSQDSNASNSGVHTGAVHPHIEDHAKRMRIDSQSAPNPPQTHVNNHNTVNNLVNERRDPKEHHGKDRSNKHNRMSSSSSSHKGNMANSNEKEHNTKHHRNKHHHKQQQHVNPTSEESAADVNVSKCETETAMANCINKTEDDHNTDDHDMETKPKCTPSISSEDEEVSEIQLSTHNPNKTPSGGHKHKEHGSGGHHSRHKSSKREREHHREKKRHSTTASVPQTVPNTSESVLSTPPATSGNVATDEEMISSSGQPVLQRRTSGHSNLNVDGQSKPKREHSTERKLSRCSEERNIHQTPQTPSSRQNSYNKSTPQSGSRRMLLSSAEDTDGGGVGGLGCEDDEDDSDAANRKHSIFDIPDEGPYVSMYDKVKARSCKNMQKQEEEKKIKAKFSQLKQSRAKREEKKRSTSYDGDSDSDFEGAGDTPHQRHHNRSGGSYKMLSGALTSTDEEQDHETDKLSPTEDRRRNSQASSSAASTHPHRLCSDSDDNSENQRRLKIQDNIRRLCDVDDSSEDDLIRRNNSSVANKRLLHHTSRIASDSESQSQSAPDIKLKQEPIETSNDDGTSTPILKHLKHKIKKEVDVMEADTGHAESSDFDEIKLKHLNSLQSSADEQAITATIKTETDLLSANEIKKEYKEFYGEDYMESEQKFEQSPVASASQHCSPEQAKIKKHKKSKKRQKTPTQDTTVKEQNIEDMVKHSPTTNVIENTTSSTQSNLKNAKHLSSSPCYDAFDELKRGETHHVTNALVDTPASAAVSEKKRHKDRKEKKREKLRHLSADIGQGLEMDKLYEKEKHHRLKKSKKSKSLDLMRQNSAQSTTSMLNLQMASGTSLAGSFTPQHKQRCGGEKMEDIFGPISDEDDEEMTDSDIAGRDLNCLPNRNASTSNVTGPIVSAALNPYKQEPLTPKSHTVEENEENKQKCPSIIGTPAHLERAVERQHRKEKREKKRKEREKSRAGSEHNQAAVQFMSTSAVASSKPLEDENSVDLDAAGRALEAQLMEDSDNKATEDATPSTATTYRSDMTDVFRFSDGDENSLDMGTNVKSDKKDNEKEHAASTSKSKEKKKKKKRSKEEKQLHHQRRESSSSNASQQTACAIAPSCSSNNIPSKLTVDIQAATKHALKSNADDQQSSITTSPLCKPSPSLPCLIGEDDEEMISTTPTLQGSKSTPNTSLTCTTACTTPHRSSKDLLSLSPHMRDKQMISPIPKTPTISNTSGLNSMENSHKLTPTTPTSSVMDSALNTTPITTTPTSSTGNAAAVASNLNKSNDSTTSSTTSNAMASPTSIPTTQKKKPDIFIPGFDGEIDERISESAVQSISNEFNTPLDPSADEPKIPVESPPDASKLEKLEESKSRVTISQEETESAVSALLGESFGNSSADYSFNDDDDVALEDLNTGISEPEPAMTSAEPDEEAALAAKAIECEVPSTAITEVAEEDSEEVCKAVQSLRQEELEIKADTPQSVRDLQIDTDTEENPDEADSSGSHSLKIDETAQSNTSSATSDKANTTNPSAEDQLETSISTNTNSAQQQSSVITKVEPSSTMASTEPKIEPPTITKQDQPAVQPVQTVIPTSASVDVSLSTTVTSVAITTTSTIVSSMNTSSSAVVSMTYTSTPVKTALTFAPSTTASSTPKQSPITQSTTVKPLSLSQGTLSSYAMQPPTITIPEPTTHFVVPQLVLSPRGVVTGLNDTSSSASSSIHSPQPSGHHMPSQSPIGAAYMMGMRAQSPHSPRHTSRGNTPTPRQQSPHTPTAPPAVVVTPQQQQQNILIQRAVHQQQQQTLMSPPTHVQGPQTNSPMASPNTQPRQQQLVAPMATGGMQKVSQQHSPGTPEQHMIKINNYSTPPSQTANIVNIRIPSQAQHPNQLGGQPQSPQQSHVSAKTFIDQHTVPMGQHILPISVQKMPPVPTHPTIISKVVTVTPQQAQQSTIQQGSGGQQQSPKSTIYSPPASRQTPQIIQQMGKTIGQQQQQQQTQTAQIHMMQQRQQQQQHHQQQQHQRQQMQQHIMQMQHQQIMHQQQQQHQKIQQQALPQQHAYAASQQQRGLTSSQQQAQQHTQAPQQPTMHQQQHQLKAQYQHQQHVAQQLLSTTVQQSQTQQQQNVIQAPSTPQRFLVQQHIVGIPSHMQQHSPQASQQQQQQRSSPTIQHQQQSPPIYGKSHSQQGQSQSQQLQQPPTQQRLQISHQESANAKAIKETPRVIVSTPQQNSVPSTESSGTNANAILDKQASPPVTNKQAEVVSVIRTPTPTTLTTGTTVAIPTTTKDGPSAPTATTTNVARSAPLTEENVIKISPPKQDEIEQDSKEDSDYWSAKELNVVESHSSTPSTNTSTVSTVIKKNETVTSTDSATTNISVSKEVESKTKPSLPNETKSETKSNTINLVDSGDSNNMPSLDAVTSVVPPPTPSYNLSGNVTTDHDTEDETETQQMPAFEQVSVQGRPNTRGTGAKRGRQPRGGKKTTAAVTVPVSTPNQQPPTEIVPTTGVQTRLRKPNAAMPATRGRKGRPPRNLLLQQQEQQMQSATSQISATNVSTSPGVAAPILTAAEKKARSQAAAAAATLASLSESHQQADVYEFHDDSGEESKSNNTASATSVPSSSDSRPRLILTIKSPHQTTPLVKATEKPAITEQQPTVPTTIAETQQQQDVQAMSDIAQTATQSDPTTADLNSMANTRKSRRLLEKDRSTIDDIIEDVVRNTAVPGGGAGAAQQVSANAPAVILTNTLPKGAQTPPRRSGRNSTQPKTKGGAEVQAIATGNPIGRPRKSKDRKSITDLDNEQTPSPQSKPVAHDVNEVEETKTVDTPTTPAVPVVSVETTQQTTSAPQTTAVSTTVSPTTAPMSQQPTSTVATTIPQHPKKKALAAAEIESYQSQTSTPNIHSALPAGGVPMLNTAAPASQKTTGGAADSVNKPLIDPVTGIVSGLQMQQAKEGNLPSATAAAQPPRVTLDPKKMMQAAVAAAAAEISVVNNKTLSTPPTMQGPVATPITALTKPVLAEATAASTAASTVTTAMLNKSVSVVVKTSVVPPTQPTPTVVMQQQIQIAQTSQQQGTHQPQQQPRSEISTPTKQPIIMQQQAPLVMHAQHSNVRPPTSLKAHVLNSHKLQQHPQPMSVTATPIVQQSQQHQPQTQQKQPHQQLQQTPTGTPQTPGHVIQSNIAQRQTPPQTQKQQLLVNIPAPAQHSPHAVANTLNSPRMHSQLSQQQHPAIQHQPIIIKQGQELHPSQILHVVSSKATPPTPNKTAAVPHSAVHHVQQTPSATHPFNPYIQQTQPSAQHHSAHQPPMAGQQKATASPLVLPPGLMSLQTHPAMVIQTKTSVPGQSPSGSSASVTHLQHPSQHTPSPPLQVQHLGKAHSNPMLHTLQTQGTHVLSAVGSPPPTVVKPSPQTSTMTTNVVGGASNLRTAIPSISPQSQARMGPILLAGGMQVPPHFETTMHDITSYGSSGKASARNTQSPPPAHQQASPITPSDASFPGGPIRGVPTREHLMIYQQLLRQHDPLNPPTLREYDEKLLGSSPPLELRRPGSVPRTVAVPHSLQSPQDRATDSPQVQQVYVHNTRIPAHAHYDVTGRAAPTGGPPSAYYDPARQITLEPPPAHRSASAHTIVAPPPTVVVPHPASGSSSPFMAAAPPATAVPTVTPTGGAPGSIHHPKLIEREREQREREQQLMREKEQILVRAGDNHSMQVATPPPSTHQLPPHAQGPPPPHADSLLTLLQRYPVMWQGLLALKTDSAAVQMHFVFGNPHVARASLPCNSDGSTPPLRIAQRMRLEQTQLDGVAKKMQFENEHCMLLALPCGRDHADVLQQSRNLQTGFITYLQQKMAAGIVNIAMPGSDQSPAYVVHIFPSCDFANENLEKAAPDLKNRVADIAHLLIVIATV